MTTNQAISHQEQMEAVRAEFKKFWHEIKQDMPDTFQLLYARKADQTAQIIAWHAFRKGKGL